MVPVPFPHEEDSLEKGLEMRRISMEHLANGGVLILFPAGQGRDLDRLVGPGGRGGVERVHRTRC